MTEPVRGPGRPTPFGAERDPARVVAFSDAVIAIAVTLLVLEIRPPQDTRHLSHGLATLWPSYLAYVVTFMLIGQVWANHHVMFDHIRSVDRTVLFLNTVLLMDIAFLPFAASVLAGGPSGAPRCAPIALVGAATGTQSTLAARLRPSGVAVVLAAPLFLGQRVTRFSRTG